MRSAWLVAGLLACTSREATLPPEGAATPERLLTLPGYSEGVAFDARGTGFISVGRNAADTHAVYQFGPSSEPTLWIRLRIPNGQQAPSTVPAAHVQRVMRQPARVGLQP